jgi:hypothetical protein
MQRLRARLDKINRTTAGYYIVLICIIAFATLVILALLGPASGNIFSNIYSTL